MARVTAFVAKTRFGELLERVAKGEEVVITRHDKPVPRLLVAATDTKTVTDAANSADLPNSKRRAPMTRLLTVETPRVQKRAE